VGLEVTLGTNKVRSNRVKGKREKV
jgi:hypothetical protein